MLEKLLDQEFLREVVATHWYLGPLIGFGLPFVESLLPVLPLVAIVAINTYIFGPYLGFLFSYAGNVVGSLLVFTFFKYVFRKREKKQFKRIKFINEERMIPLMLIYCFPFTPSSVVNATCGYLKFDRDKFIAALAIGKFIMLILLTYVGSNISDFILTGNIKSLVITGIVLGLAYLIGKLVEKYFEL